MSPSSPSPILVADPLAATLRPQAAAVEAAIRRVLASGRYILGPEVEGFEREFAHYLGAGGEAVGVANGTDALELALRAAGVGPGATVATVANTVTATVAAIAATGAQPRLVEIDPVTMTMSPDHLAEVLASERIAAVVPVHLYGQPADIASLAALAERHGAVLVEDGAQAHGATRAGRKLGTWGRFGAFSFYPTKNLGALGDGGLVWCRDAADAARVRALRQYGWTQRYISETTGRNSRLDELQAAVLRVLLPGLDAANARRCAVAERYLAAFAGTPLRLPPRDPGAVYHQFAVRTPRRDALRDHLVAAGVQAAVLYPVPVHRQPGYQQPGTSLPETERACAEVLCLPVHPGLTDDEVERVIGAVQSWRP